MLKEKKYKLSSISKEARFRTYEDSFVWLNEAMIVNTCFNATDPNVGLALSADHTTQKCYMADTGLLVTHTFMDNAYTDNELYRAVLFDHMDINEGMIMENVVAQTLRCNGHKLYFYSRCDSERRENHMEIDFLITEGKKIAPIEVKSGNYRSHASLDKFKKKFSSNIGNSYILYTKDLMEKEDLALANLYGNVSVNGSVCGAPHRRFFALQLLYICNKGRNEPVISALEKIYAPFPARDISSADISGESARSLFRIFIRHSLARRYSESVRRMTTFVSRLNICNRSLQLYCLIRQESLQMCNHKYLLLSWQERAD
jgi:hypothetical protein